MISCIVIDDAESMKKDYEKLFNKLFNDNRFEIKKYENGMTLFFIHKVEKIKVWQVVLNLEIDQVSVGFGFGTRKEVAKEEALNRLTIISEMNIN